MSQSMAWRPLGSTWRERSVDYDGPVRENADEGQEFVQGCVPQWGRGGCKRRIGQLEHELTWRYYRMRKHKNHPQYREVGDQLPLKNVPPAMRLSKNAAFRFWRDCRPPFRVSHVERVDEGADSKHADGDLFNVSYNCGIDYCSERLYGDTSTFDNMIQGVAVLRIPDEFPTKRPVFVSWGRPTLSSDKNKDLAQKKAKAVDPEQFLPIANEVGLRPDHPRFKSVRDTVKKTAKEMNSPPPKSTSLPRLVRQESQGLNSTQTKTVRQHRMHTSACGFISYAG